MAQHKPSTRCAGKVKKYIEKVKIVHRKLTLQQTIHHTKDPPQEKHVACADAYGKIDIRMVPIMYFFSIIYILKKIIKVLYF